MTRRALIRLAIAAGGLVVVLVVALVVVVIATSAPELPPPRTVASPNAQTQTLISAGQGDGLAQTDLAYEDTAHPDAADPTCGAHGRWSLDVNPEDVVGHPYAVPPSARDWARASAAAITANSICPAGVMLTWVGHDRAHPASDRWVALLPLPFAANLDGPALRRFALRHARQM